MTEKENKERIEIKNVSLEIKNKLKLFCDSENISMSDYILALINKSLEEKDLELIEEDIKDLGENPNLNIQTFKVEPPVFESEGEKRVSAWIVKETRRVLKEYNHAGYLTVDNLYLAEHLVKAKGFICQKVVSDPNSGSKKWLLIEGKKIKPTEGVIENV